MSSKERQRQILAWTVVLACFAVFLALVSGLFLALRWYVDSARESQSAQLTIVSGTVLVRDPGQSAWVGATTGMGLESGASIKTDDTSEALVTLFDKSTVVLYPRTELALLTLDQARFDSNHRLVRLFQNRGQTRITLSQLGEERRFEVQGPQGAVLLDKGSFSVGVGDDMEVRTREETQGSVTGAGSTVTLDSSQKTRVQDGQPPTAPQAAQEELVTNGHFQDGLAGWQVGQIAGFASGQDILGQANLTLENGEPVIQFQRRGSRNTHSEVYVTQNIDRDVTDFSTLQLRIGFKLLNQSLSGGGYMGSEYPLHVRVDYETARGQNFAAWGFYYQNQDQNRTDIGTQVSQSEWLDHVVGQNLMELSPRPRRIISITVSASGWDYESLLKGISLTGE